MVKHIVMWSFQETLDDKQKKEAAVRIKEGLERLTGIVPGLISVKVVTDALPASTHEIGLFCELESQEALVIRFTRNIRKWFLLSGQLPATVSVLTMKYNGDPDFICGQDQRKISYRRDTGICKTSEQVL